MRHANSPSAQASKDEATFVLERREQARIDCHIYAYIHINGAKICNCVIRNLSAGGARITVPASCWIPSAFEIVGLVDDGPVKARRVWISGEEMGVCFVNGE